MAITMARLGGSSEFLNYILDVMWQRLLHMLHDVSSSLPCLLAMISVAHHCDRRFPDGSHSIFHMELICNIY